MFVLPLRRTSTSWINGPRGISQSSAKENAYLLKGKVLLLGGITPSTSRHQELISWEAISQKRAQASW